MKLVPCPRCEEKRVNNISRKCALCHSDHPYVGMINKEKAVKYILLRGDALNDLGKIILCADIKEEKSIEECKESLKWINERSREEQTKDV